MATITLRGTGQLNGPVIIDKTIEIDDVVARSFHGSNKEELILSTLEIHYPGVKINPKQIGINVIHGSAQKPSIKTEDNSKLDFIMGAATGAILDSINDDDNEYLKSFKSDINNEELEYIPRKSKSLKDLESLIYSDLSGNKLQIENTLDEIYLTLKSNKWSLLPLNSEEDKEKAILLNKVFEKYKIGFRKLKKMNNDEIELKPYSKQLKRLYFKKIFGQFSVYILLFVFSILVILFT